MVFGALEYGLDGEEHWVIAEHGHLCTEYKGAHDGQVCSCAQAVG